MLKSKSHKDYREMSSLYLSTKKKESTLFYSMCIYRVLTWESTEYGCILSVWVYSMGWV